MRVESRGQCDADLEYAGRRCGRRPGVQPGTFSVHGDAQDPVGADRWDTWYDNTYHCWREMYWSDTTTLGQRYNLVIQDNLRGVGFWILDFGGGSPELWTLLAGKFEVS